MCHYTIFGSHEQGGIALLLYLFLGQCVQTVAQRRRWHDAQIAGTARRAVAGALATVALAGIQAPALAEDCGRTAYVLVSEASWLNIREQPQAHASVVLRLSRGDALTLYAIDENGWAEVSRAGDPGYCRAAYLCDEPPAPALRCRTTAGKLRVRDAPLGKVLRKLKAGVTVTVRGYLTDDAGDRWANLGNGFVMAAFLESAEPETVP